MFCVLCYNINYSQLCIIIATIGNSFLLLKYSDYKSKTGIKFQKLKYKIKNWNKIPKTKIKDIKPQKCVT